MAIFGNLETVKLQVEKGKFDTAFEYLERVISEGSSENQRLSALPVGAFEKIDLDLNNFALEQVYDTKERAQCFFESHREYIDVQFILEGEEIIEVADIRSLDIDFPYDQKMDLIKYLDTADASVIRLRKGDIAIFYPDDAHMPCVKTASPGKVIKTVVKVSV